MGTGEADLPVSFLPLFSMGSTLIEENLLHCEKIFCRSRASLKQTRSHKFVSLRKNVRKS